MKRRAILATTAAAALAGCSSLTGSDSGTSDDDSNGGDENGSGSPEPIDEKPGTFDDFEDLSKWTVMSGSMDADTDRAYTGSQSARVTAAESEERAMIKREFESPRDLSNEWPSLALAADRDVSVVVQLSDVDGNRYLLRSAVSGDLPLAPHDLGVHDTVGEPDLSEIEHVKISFWAGEDRSLTIWCDDLHFVSRPDVGKVMVQFDEGFETTTAARDVLAAHDVPATVFVNTGRVGGEGRLDVDQLHALADDGWTVASQGSTGGALPQWDADDQRADLETAKTWLADNGFEDGTDYLAYPLRRFDETTLEIVGEYHELAFASGYSAHGEIANPHLIPRIVHPDADEARRLLDRTATMRGIATIAYRELDGAGLEALEATMAHLADLESAGELEVVLPDEVAANHLH
jgi:hypothetical protein